MLLKIKMRWPFATLGVNHKSDIAFVNSHSYDLAHGSNITLHLIPSNGILLIHHFPFQDNVIGRCKS